MKRRRTVLALVGIPLGIAPLMAAVTLGAHVPAHRTLDALPASAPLDYDNRFSTGFASLREGYLLQVLGLHAAPPAGAVTFGGSRGHHRPAVSSTSRDLLAQLPVGGGRRLSPDPLDQPTGIEFWRSRDPSISADGSTVAYLSSDTRIEGMGSKPCLASPPGPTVVSVVWKVWRHRFAWAPPPDPGPCDQVVVLDVRTGDTQIASVSQSGELANAVVERFMVSGDGRYVTFATTASNLVPGDTNDTSDVFVRDLVAGRTELVTVSIHGGPIRRPPQDYPEQLGFPVSQEVPDVLGSVGASNPAISHDGRYVLFESSAADLVPGDTPQSVDVFVRDRLRGTTERVSLSSSGEPMSRADAQQDNRDRLDRKVLYSARPCMSPNGRYVAFRSWGSNLVPGDRNDRPDIFLRDRVTGLTELVTVSSTGEQQDGESIPSYGYAWTSPWVFAGKNCVSDDGRHVSYLSWSTNLVEGDTNDTADLFLRDRRDGTTRRISLNFDGSEAHVPREGFLCLGDSPTCDDVPPPTGEAAALSADGRFVIFQSWANLDPDDPDLDPDDDPRYIRNPRRDENIDMDLYAYDIAQRRLARLEVRDLAWARLFDHEAGEFSARVGAPAVSGDGSLVVFHTTLGDTPTQFTGGVHLFRWRAS